MHLLQISDDAFFFYAIVGFLGFIVGIFIARKIFMMSDIKQQMNMQTRLLAKMAKQQGVDEKEIRQVLGLKADPIPESADNEMADIIIRYGRDVAIKEAAARRKNGDNDALDYIDNIITSRKITGYQK